MRSGCRGQGFDKVVVSLSLVLLPFPCTGRVAQLLPPLTPQV